MANISTRTPTACSASAAKAELAVDDNPYLHRHFLQISRQNNLWWLHNIGAGLAATVSDDNGGVQAWISPGAALPLVFGTSVIRFTAGPTLYELTAHLADAPYLAPTADPAVSAETTIGRVDLTADQKLLHPLQPQARQCLFQARTRRSPRTAR